MDSRLVPAIFALLLISSAAAMLLFGPKGTQNEDLRMEKVLECKNGTVREKELCFDLFMQRKIEVNATKELMAELASVMEKSEEMELSCHEVAHSIGRVSMLQPGKSLADVFSECTQTCHSGCYHGAMQAFFLKETMPDADVYELRDEHVSLSDLQRVVNRTCAELENRGAKWFQCLHGMGHAIQFSLENNLTMALGVCDMLATDFERNSCYGGAIMENLVSEDRETRQIKHGDPQYPCSGLEEKYKYQCYMMQPSVMMEIFDYDASKVVESCKDAGAYVGTCYLGLGRDLSDDFRVDKGTAYDIIGEIPETYRMDYVSGLVYALADNTWDGRYAFPFCSGLDEELKGGCYSTAINYLNTGLFVSMEEIESSCRAYSPEVQFCISRIPGRESL